MFYKFTKYLFFLLSDQITTFLSKSMVVFPFMPNWPILIVQNSPQNSLNSPQNSP